MPIQLSNLSKNYGQGAVVADVNLEIPSGELTALLGPSGSGKTTVLKMIGGIEKPTTGRIVIEGRDVTDVDARYRDIGYCFQAYAPFRHMSVAKNVGFGLSVRGTAKKEIRQRVGELLELVRLSDKANRYPAQLSGGERQRMALARALAIEPQVLLLDEPFGALDAVVRSELRSWLKELHQRLHVTTILVTHDQEEAMDLAATLVVMHQGRIEQVGRPLEVYDQPVNSFVQSFLGPTTLFDGVTIRPHDLVVSPSGPDVVTNIDDLGFEIRIAVTRASGEQTWVQLSRPEFLDTKIASGDAVSVSRR